MITSVFSFNQGDDNVYLDLTGEGSSSGNDVTYDDVRVTSGQKEIPKLRKKAPPPKPPQLSKIPSENEIIDDVAENVNNYFFHFFISFL